MAVFLDTGFYYALIRKEDPHHPRANEILGVLATGKHGRAFTSDYIMDECMTLISVRSGGRRDLIERMGCLFIGPATVAHMHPIEPAWLDEIRSLQVALTTKGRAPSFTDCSTIVCCKKHTIPRVVSFDGHFAGQLDVIA